MNPQGKGFAPFSQGIELRYFVTDKHLPSWAFAFPFSFNLPLSRVFGLVGSSKALGISGMLGLSSGMESVSEWMGSGSEKSGVLGLLWGME